jgi:hypothetical protein
MAIWYIFWQFGIILGPLIYFSHFGMFVPNKNLAALLNMAFILAGLYSLNEKVAAARAAASQPQAAGSDSLASYAAPAQPDYSRQGRRFNN